MLLEFNSPAHPDTGRPAMRLAFDSVDSCIKAPAQNTSTELNRHGSGQHSEVSASFSKHQKISLVVSLLMTEWCKIIILHFKSYCANLYCGRHLRSVRGPNVAGPQDNVFSYPACCKLPYAHEWQQIGGADATRTDEILTQATRYLFQF